MKQEWRKHEKELYLPKQVPTIINVPEMNYLAIEGVGDPNGDLFGEKTSALYSLAYALRMASKQGIEIDGYKEYTVYPLEGDWSFVDGWDTTKPMDKSKLAYVIMIRQPEFIKREDFESAFERVSKKKPSIYLKDVKFITQLSIEAIQILHIGSFDTESESFAKMEDFTKQENLGHARQL